jgi:pimeloyl-ACP methyl ester carboxylesterase
LLHTEFFIKLMAGMMKMPPENYDGFRRTMRAMSPSSFTRSFLQALSQRQPPGMEKAACPVLFVAGEKEPQAVRDSNTMLAKLLPHATARIAPGMGHGWLAENPDLHVQMVSAWISDAPLPSVLKVTD